MKLPSKVEAILDRALEGHALTREECAFLLNLPEGSLEATATRAVADILSRRRFGNQAMLLGQIGIDTAPCPGNCKFCVFGKDHTTFEKSELSFEDILARAHAFADAIAPY